MAEPPQSDLFREEALRHHAHHAPGGEPRALLEEPAWLSWMYWGLLAACAGAAALSAVVRIGSEPLLLVLLPGLRGVFGTVP